MSLDDSSFIILSGTLVILSAYLWVSACHSLPNIIVTLMFCRCPEMDLDAKMLII